MVKFMVYRTATSAYMLIIRINKAQNLMKFCQYIYNDDRVLVLNFGQNSVTENEFWGHVRQLKKKENIREVSIFNVSLRDIEFFFRLSPPQDGK